MTTETTYSKKIVLYVILEFCSCIGVFTVHLSVLELTQAKCVMPALSSKCLFFYRCDWLII